MIASDAGETIQALRIGNGPVKTLVVAAHHGNEYGSVEVALGFAADAQGPIYDEARAAFADAWGVQPVDIGVGGSIPFVAAFAEKFPDAAILVTGVEDRGLVQRVSLDVSGQRIHADVTPSALLELSLGNGDAVVAVVKATQVTLHPAS